MTIVIKIRIPAFFERLFLPLVLFYRRLSTGRPFRKIPLTQSKFALVDPDDYLDLVKYKWHASKGRFTYYAQRKAWNPKLKKEYTIKMHRQVLNFPAAAVIDHINHNGLDNRKVNLRPATYSQNTCNSPAISSKILKNTSSKYRGVTWHKHKQKWHARIRVNNKTISLGYYNCPTAAARAYDSAAHKYHKQFATLNFPYTFYSTGLLFIY